MKTYTHCELNEILAKHKQWLSGIDGGVRADLSYANLRYADLSYADLSYADLSSADLRSADLSYADLRSADLSYANLSSADLSSANLRSADLSSADLRSADLSYANLSYADLSSADLRSADLRSAIGEMLKLRSMQIEKYMVSYTDEILNIGCQSHTIEEWNNFSDETISEMDIGALDWWVKWKPIIMQIINMAPAEPTGYIQKDEQ